MTDEVFRDPDDYFGFVLDGLLNGIEKKQGIGDGLASKSNWLVKISVVLILVCSRHLGFKEESF